MTNTVTVLCNFFSTFAKKGNLGKTALRRKSFILELLDTKVQTTYNLKCVDWLNLFNYDPVSVFKFHTWECRCTNLHSVTSGFYFAHVFSSSVSFAISLRGITRQTSGDKYTDCSVPIALRPVWLNWPAPKTAHRSSYVRSLPAHKNVYHATAALFEVQRSEQNLAAKILHG